MHRIFSLILVIAPLCGCSKNGGDTSDTVNTVDPTTPPSDKTTWWKPVAGVSFDWDLDDLADGDSFDADVVDVDAFTTSAAQVAWLHAQGKKVIAYLSVGTIENYRPDAGLLPSEVVGRVYPEWPDERWLDIRQPEKLKPWLYSRINMILAKGFDAIEPDNLDSYENTTGFDISVDDLKNYLDLLIDLAHSNGLGIGQKNVPDLSVAYRSKFDWVLTEDAFQQGWQADVQPYIAAGKPVFAVEYTDETSQSKFQDQYCPQAKGLGYSAILKKRNLNKWSYRCK